MPFVLLLQHILDIRRKRDKPDMPFVLVLQHILTRSAENIGAADVFVHA